MSLQGRGIWTDTRRRVRVERASVLFAELLLRTRYMLLFMAVLRIRSELKRPNPDPTFELETGSESSHKRRK